MISNKRGFTLLELLVVIAMIGVILGALTTSIGAAQERARMQKALSEVKVITQAILGFENYERGGKFELPVMTKADADSSSLGFLLGKGETADTGDKIPALLMASIQGGGKIRDPWGTPYKITIKKGSGNVKMESASGSMRTGYYIPNFYRLSEEERK